LSTGPKYNDQVTVNGRAIPKVVINQKLSQVCNSARVKVPYNCQNGECGTCTVLMNGKKIRACVSKVPAGKCAIQTL
jgi:aerobic-type carbon monoxide dehydrogenase small subunit (CoxS/CutS family)